MPVATYPAVVASENAADLTLREAERASTYEYASLSAATLRAYAQGWTDFEAWATQHRTPSLPAAPETVGRYLADLADQGRAVATLRRRAAAIARAHDVRGLADPCASAHVRNVLSGIARTFGAAQKKKDALTLDRLRAVLFELDDSLQDARDRALILLGFAGAFRRSELAALDVEDLRWETRGIVATLRRSKTDQKGKGREIGIPALADGRPTIDELCPVRALRAWLEASGIANGPLFRTFGLPRGREAQALTPQRIDARDVARVLQRAAARAGIAGDFAAHSLRAGFITAAAAAHVSEIDIARVSGHKSADILRGYVRHATVLEAPPLYAMITRETA
jgi:integrase